MIFICSLTTWVTLLFKICFLIFFVLEVPPSALAPDFASDLPALILHFFSISLSNWTEFFHAPNPPLATLSDQINSYPTPSALPGDLIGWNFNSFLAYLMAVYSSACQMSFEESQNKKRRYPIIFVSVYFTKWSKNIYIFKNYKNIFNY